MKAAAPNSVDVIITDPPYDDHTHKSHSHRTEANGYRTGIRNGFRQSEDFGFDPITSYDWIHDAVRVARRWVLCFCSVEQLGRYQDAAPDHYKRGWLWIKTNAQPQFTGDRPGAGCEGLACLHGDAEKMRWNGKGRHRPLEHPKDDRGRIHPTQKPDALCREVVELFTEPGETILDPFCGSGSMGLAALDLGRNYIGMDIGTDRKSGRAWADLASDRLTGWETGVSLSDKSSGQIGMFA